MMVKVKAYSPTAGFRFDPEKLALELARHGLNGKALAELTGIDKSTISDVRQGKPMRLETMRRIVDAIATQPLVEGAELLA